MSEAAAAPATAAPAPTAPTAPISPVDRVREFFTLDAAERAVRAIPEGPRATAARELALAFQKRAAAETLWPRGSCAEALRLARASVDAAASALESFASAMDTRHDWVAKAQAIASAAREKTTARALPELESETKAEDEETFRVLTDAALAIEDAVGRHLAGAAELTHVRRARVAIAAVSAVVAVIVIAWLAHTPAFTGASSSSFLSTEYGPEKAIDGSDKTNWYAPNGQAGFLDLTLGRARAVRTVRIESSNPPFDDRATKDARVACVSNGAVVKDVNVTFPPPNHEAVWTDVQLDAPSCDHLRVEAKTFYGQGAGIGEVELK